MQKLIGYFQSLSVANCVKERSEAIGREGFYDENAIQEKIRLILAYATARAPFYRRYSGAELQDFPVVDKNQIKRNFSAFVANKARRRTWRTVSTSGSTGEPFQIFQDRKKMRAQRADVMAMNQACGWVPGQRILYMRIWKEFNRPNFVQKWIGRIRPLDGSNLSKKATLTLLSRMSMNEPFLLLGYGSSLDAFAQHIVDMGVGAIPGAMTSCVAMAEPVSAATRDTIKCVFGCDVYSRYSNAENGLIAHELPGMEGYVVNQTSFYVELLDWNTDRPVGLGKPGRIVVTDLNNFAVPFLRYDTGDIGVSLRNDSFAGRVGVLANIEGRALDAITNAEGVAISPHLVDYSLRFIPGIRRFQFEQLAAADYRIRILGNGSVDVRAIECALGEVFGRKAKIEVVLVDYIEPEPSGKRPLIINRMARGR